MVRGPGAPRPRRDVDLGRGAGRVRTHAAGAARAGHPLNTSRYEAYLRDRHRPAHARRTADTTGAFFLPYLRPGMVLLDVGCGPATITAGLAAAVAGEGGFAVGVDRTFDWATPAGSVLVAGDAYRLPFPDASFDAVFACAVLQHLADPAAALAECRRVSRPGAVIGVADVDWDGLLLAPRNAALDRAAAIREGLRRGTSPRVGKELRGLLHAAGFSRPAAWVSSGRPRPDPAGIAAFEASFFEAPAAVERVVALGLSSAGEMAEIAAAWRAWGDDPGAFHAAFWCEAVAFVDG